MVLSGHRNVSTGLWTLPIAPIDKPWLCTDRCDLSILHHFRTQQKMKQANNAYTMPTAKARVKYLHQCLFSPPTTTLINAIHNNQLSKWPGLTESAIR